MRTEITLPQNYNALTGHQRRTVRLAYELRQGGKCYHCQADLAGPPAPHVACLPINWQLFPGGTAFLRYKVHLHHCHSSGLTLGAVHAYCNAALWQYHGE